MNESYNTLLKVNLITELNKRNKKKINASYSDREGRNIFAAQIISNLHCRNILNIGGGGKRYLEKYLGAQYYFHELDITGECDTRLNLDSV